MNIKKIFFLIAIVFVLNIYATQTNVKKIAYIVSDLDIPYWSIMAKGIASKAKDLDYSLKIYNSHNLAKIELQNTVLAIQNNVSAIIISPTNSSAAVTLLKLAKKANIPVVVLDIGSDSDDYVTYISSDNYQGGYKLGKILTKEMKKRSWEDGAVGIISIPQKRQNGKLRTAGFIKALDEANIKNSNLYQQVDFTYDETYRLSMKLIKRNKNLRAIWLQGSDKYQAALDALKYTKKTKDILLLCFDAEEIFLDLIPKGVLLASAMQQPFLMGEEALVSIDAHLRGKSVKKTIKLSILAISKDNLQKNKNLIYKNVLGLEK